MENQIISFEVEHPGSGLLLTVKIDQQQIWQGQESFSGIIEVPVPEQDGPHVLEICLSGKQPHHTTIDQNNNIVDDVVISIKNISIDNINIDQMIYKLTAYNHDQNGTLTSQTDTFYGVMGCNGSVRLPFHTPIFLWLLENM